MSKMKKECFQLFQDIYENHLKGVGKLDKKFSKGFGKDWLVC